MSKPCICIDVSKDSSHIQGFIVSINTPICRPIKISHTKIGFNKIKDLYISLLKQTNIKPLVIFEYTGVYHKCLISYLELQNYDYHIVSPLRSAKNRSKELRGVKTDKRDCKNLAEMFYTDKLGIFKKQDKIYQDLKDLHKEYHTNKIHLQKLEVTLNELIDTIYPCFNKLFSDLLAKSSLDFFTKFYHPEIIINTKINDLINFFMNDTVKHSYQYSKMKALEVLDYANSIISGCSINSFIITFFLDTIKQLKLLIDIQKDIETKLIELAKTTPYFTIIRSIPGIGDNTCARLIAELGDISRFNKPNQMIAFLGIDPIVDESGKKTGDHLPMTKKGNKKARSILFLMVRSMVRNRVCDNPIKAFYKKKKAQPNIAPKVALFASIHKLIRMIHSLCNTGSVYEYSIPQK